MMDMGPEFDMGPMDFEPEGFDMPSDGIAPDFSPGDIDPSGFDVPAEPAYDFGPMDLEPEPEILDMPVEPDYNFGPMELEPGQFEIPAKPYAPAFELEPMEIPPADMVWTPDTLWPPIDDVPLDMDPFEFTPLPETLEPEPFDVAPNLVLPDVNTELSPIDIPDVSPDMADLPTDYNVPDVAIAPDTSDVEPSTIDFTSQENLINPEPVPDIDTLVPEEHEPMDINDPTLIKPVPDGDGFSDNPEPENLEIPPFSIEPFTFDPLPSSDTPSEVHPVDSDSFDVAPAADIPSLEDSPGLPVYPDGSPESNEGFILVSPEYEQYRQQENIPENEPGFGPKPSWSESPDSTSPVDVAIQPAPTDTIPELVSVDETSEAVEPTEVKEPQAPEFVPSGDIVLQSLDDPTALDIRQIGEPDDAADFWRQQEGPNDCALYAQGTILEAFGQNFDVEKYQQQGIEDGWYSPEGGTTVANFGDLLEENGVEVTHYDSGATIKDMAAELEQGHGVLVAVDTGRIWDDPEPGGHALVVTGIHVGPDGVPTEVICNDSGRPDGKVIAYSFEDFKASWEQYDNYMVATKDPIPNMH